MKYSQRKLKAIKGHLSRTLSLSLSLVNICLTTCQVTCNKGLTIYVFIFAIDLNAVIGISTRPAP